MSCVVGSCTQVPPGKADLSHSDGRKMAGNNFSFYFSLLLSLHSYVVLSNALTIFSLLFSLLRTTKEMSSVTA